MMNIEIKGGYWFFNEVCMGFSTEKLCSIWGGTFDITVKEAVERSIDFKIGVSGKPFLLNPTQLQ